MIPEPAAPLTTRDVNGQSIAYDAQGDGLPVLLLHGFPQTRAMWRRIAPVLAADFRVICADLRGYGDSSKPETLPEMSFRAMAADMVALMQALGHDRFHLVGHDRGARVTHRMLLDHPERVARAALLDILPTAYVYAHTDRALAILTARHLACWTVGTVAKGDKDGVRAHLVGRHPRF